jgi:transposase
MRRYIGIDVHSESCTVAVMGPTGKRLKEAKIETNGKALTDFIRTIAGQRHICFEEGTHSEWLYELLEPLADEVIVAIPEPVRGSKSDSRDAWSRADDLRCDRITRSVFKAPDRFTMLRAAVKAFVVSQRDMVRTKTRLANLYRSRGLSGMSSAIYDPEHRTTWLKRLPAAQAGYAMLLNTQLDALIQTHDRAHDWLLEESKKVPVVKLLMTAPGIGEIRAAQIVAVVISPYRFRTRRQFWSYCGLAVVTRSSSDWISDRHGGWQHRAVVQTRGLNRNRNAILKNAFKGAALSVLKTSEHPLRLAFERSIAAGTKPKLASLTLARRIAGAVLAIWKHNQEYDVTKQQP